MKTLHGVLLAAIVVGCSSSGGSSSPPASPTPSLTDDQQKQKAVSAMHDALLVDVQKLADAAAKIQSSAPSAPDRGWDATADAQALAATQAAWIEARTAYEHVEGALASLFPDIDVAIDARYDDFLTNSGPDQYLFDDQGVTGMHAIERILFAKQTPQRVIDFEKSLPGYVAADWPKTAQESSDFKAKLCQKLIDDTKSLLGQWQPAAIQIEIAYEGVKNLVIEQREKVNKASSNEEESRYAQRTMADIRDNLVGTKTAYAVFQPWILAKDGGKDIDAKVTKGFADLDAAYGAVQGDAIPPPPATWSSESPSKADLATPFGALYTSVQTAVDPNQPASITAQLTAAGQLLGFRQIGR